MNNKLKRFIAPLIALIGGIVFIVIGTTGLSQVKNYPEVQVTVTNIDRTETIDSDGTSTEELKVYVTYTVDGKEYNEQLQDASGNVKEGDELTVHYNPEKPSYVTATTTKGGIFRIVFGSVFAVVGLLTFFIAFIRGR